MIPRHLKTLWHGLVTLCLMATLALGAPVYNAENQAPRAVFLTLPDTAQVPTLAVTATKHDGAWLLTLDTTGFTFTAFCLPTAEPAPIGHAHIILNGQKIGSAYVPIYDLGVLPPGLHRITVILRAQDHRALLGPHGLIEADLTLIVGAEE